MFHVQFYNNKYFYSCVHVIRDTIFDNYTKTMIQGCDENSNGYPFCLNPLSLTVGRDAYKENANLASSYPK